MPDEKPQGTITDTGPRFTATWQRIIALACLGFNGSIILWVILAGNPLNTLHISALAWAWASGLAILAGIGFGTLTTLIERIIGR